MATNKTLRRRLAAIAGSMMSLAAHVRKERDPRIVAAIEAVVSNVERSLRAMALPPLPEEAAPTVPRKRMRLLEALEYAAFWKDEDWRRHAAGVERAARAAGLSAAESRRLGAAAPATTLENARAHLADVPEFAALTDAELSKLLELWMREHGHRAHRESKWGALAETMKRHGLGAIAPQSLASLWRKHTESTQMVRRASVRKHVSHRTRTRS